jgi:ATP-dependent Clp protease ATP-binding subunit ClpC
MANSGGDDGGGVGGGTMNERPLTQRARKVLDFAQSEAVSLGHDYVGTEHLLLGLVDEDEGVA